MKKAEKFQHDLKGYLNSQQSITEMCIEHFNNQEWETLEKSLALLANQQKHAIPKLISQTNDLIFTNEEN